MNNREETKENEQGKPENGNETQETPEIPAPDKNNKEEGYEEKIAELNDKYLRLYSEFDNYRKRTARERIELSKTAGEDIFKSLLPVIDDFERAMKSITDDSDVPAVREGITLIYNKFKKTLTQKGLEEMNAAGQPFDSEIHDAITNIDVPDDMKGKVVDEVEKGYFLNGKVIRHAKVVVGK